MPRGLKDDQEAAVNVPEPAGRSRLSRLQTRVMRVQAADAPPRPGEPGQVSKAMAALTQLYETGRRPSHVVVRSTFVTRRQEATGEMSDRTPPDAPPPPMLALASPNGIAQQLELIALFVAQCQQRRTRQHTLDLPLEAAQSAGLGWLDLVVPIARSSARSTVYAVSRKDARLEQLKHALGVLASNDLVRLPNLAAARGKFEGFEVLDEGGTRPTGEPLSYKLPPPSGEALVKVPVDFFLRGWVYTLTPSEVALWLMLAHQRGSLKVPGATVAVDGDRRQRLYGVKKDAYKGWWLLESAGLLEVTVDPQRRGNGTVEDFDPANPPAHHRFKLLNEGFAADARPAVLAALGAAIDGDPVGLHRHAIL